MKHFIVKLKKYLSNIYTIKFFYRTAFQPNKINYYGIQLDLDFDAINPWIKNAIYKGLYEREEYYLLNSLLNKSDTVLDIGGGIGFVALAAAQIVDCDSIFVYEANPELIQIIETNQQMNNLFFPIHNKICTGSLEQKNSTKRLMVGEHFWNATTAVEAAPNDVVRSINLEMSDLVSLILMHKANSIIIDVEGGEYELLANIKLPQQVNKILIEYHPHKIASSKINRVHQHLLRQDFQKINQLGNSYAYLGVRENRQIP